MSSVRYGPYILSSHLLQDNFAKHIIETHDRCHRVAELLRQHF